MKRSVGARRQQVAAVVARAIMKPAPRVPLREEFRRELYGYFREDVALLSRILDRDLSRWVSGS
jgi:hypothetical protein